MIRGNIYQQLLWTAWMAIALTGTSSASEKAVKINQASEIPAIWKKDQHLYVKGSVGASDSKLNALEKWLDQNAPNWTVVLMVNANGERFTEAGGRSHQGMDAVEFALGQSLPNKTAFGDFKHAETNQANGAYFLLFLEERKLSYFGSEVHDTRNLGEDRWIGNLDGPAISAMRGGGRVLDAAKDTIKSIDRQLSRKIAAEQLDKRRAADRAKRLQLEADSLILTAEREIKIAANRAKELAQDLGSPSGDLVRPDLPAWTTGVAKAKQLRNTSGAAAAGSAAEEVRRMVGSYLAKLDAHAIAPRQLDSLEKKIEGTVLHDESKLARVKLQEARTASENAQDAHARADSSFVRLLQQSEMLLADAVAISRGTVAATARLAELQKEHQSLQLHPNSTGATLLHDTAQTALDQAQTALKAGAHDISSFLAQAQTGIDSAREESRRQYQRDERRRSATITGTSVGGISLFIIGLIGNLRRRDERDEATSLLETWDRTLREKLDGLFALLDRTAITVGSIADVEKRGYTGETLRLGHQSIKDVDELFIMSSCVDDIFEQARELITPDRFFPKMVNFFATSRYKAAIRLLREEPVRFEAGDQIERIIKGKRPEWSGLLGRKEDYEAFAMSLQELVAAFDERAQRTLETLDVIEESWETIPSRLSDLQASINQANGAESELRRASALDDLFALRPVFTDLLPAAEESYQETETMGASDPVQALRGPAVAAERMTADATALISIIKSLRAELLPSLEETTTHLRRERRKTRWVDERILLLSQRADEISRTSITASATEDIAAFEESLSALGEDATNALKLETQASENTLPEIKLAEKLTTDTRATLGAALNLSADLILREDDLDPSEKLRTARAEVKSTRVSLDQGAILAARSTLETAHSLTDEANFIIERSVTVEREFADVSTRAKSNLDALENDLPAVERIVSTLSANIAASALLIGEASSDTTENSVTDFLIRARDEWISATKNWTASHTTHDKAQLIQAATLLDQCADRTQLAVDYCKEIREHEELLEKTGLANTAAFKALEARTVPCRALADEFHATEQSRTAFADAFASFDQLRLPAAGAGLDDPFDTQERLQENALSFDQFEAAIAGDELMLEDALRSAEAAANEILTAEQLAHQARTDNIVDSPQTTTSLTELADLSPQIEHVRARLQAAHEHWEQLGEQSDQIAADASRFAASLRGELRRANAAVAALLAASQEARKAMNWHGSYGISITGNPGTPGVGLARAYLNSGDYLSAHRAADDAHRKARAAINHANVDVMKEKSRRRAAERRRQSQRSSLFSSSSSSSSFGSSFGSSSSGFSSSSFSSGSGTSRSGW